MGNLRRNWLLPLSALAYFCLQASMTGPYVVGMVLGFLGITAAAWKLPDLRRFVKEKKPGLRLWGAITAAGICWAGQEKCRDALAASQRFGTLFSRWNVDAPLLLSLLCSIAAFWAVFVFVLGFWHCLENQLRSCNAFTGIGRRELLLYGLLFLAACILCTAVFFQTDAFYGTDHEYDVIYTSDSPVLVRENAYLNLTHRENDLRQPLFAVFSAPFLGGAGFLGKLLGGPWEAVLMNGALLGMLLAAAILLAQAMELAREKRICFVLLSACTYPKLLFSLMMEQYIPACFWLMLCICLICRGKRLQGFALWGAGGTLLTSLVLLPFGADPLPRGWKDWTLRGLGFAALLLIFCRFDVLYSAAAQLRAFGNFTGKSLSFLEKLLQYTVFVRSCFLAPSAEVSVALGYRSWQMTEAVWSWSGLFFLTLAAVSAVWNRDKKSSRMAAFWCIFSMVMLLFLGWGTKENGLILYTLYFGWGYFVLLFQLLEKIQERYRLRWLIPSACVLCGIAMLAVNLPAMQALVRFAVTHYPV